MIGWSFIALLEVSLSGLFEGAGSAKVIPEDIRMDAIFWAAAMASWIPGGFVSPGGGGDSGTARPEKLSLLTDPPTLAV